MPRDLTPQVVDQLKAVTVRPVFLLEAQFGSETIYVWTGIGTITWKGHDYLGVGNFGSISEVTESSDVMANGITLTLSGIPVDLLNESMNDIKAGKMAKVYMGLMDANGALIPDPIPCFIGLLDQPTIDISTETCSINITVENRLADLNRMRGGRYTDSDQRARYPQDGSLKYVHLLFDQFVHWS